MNLLSKCKKLLDTTAERKRPLMMQVSSALLAGATFLSVLALPHFSTPPGQSNDDEKYFILHRDAAVLPPTPSDELIPGTGYIDSFFTQAPTPEPEETQGTPTEEADQVTPPNTSEPVEGTSSTGRVDPPTTEPPVTEPPVTEPPVTEPPMTEPPVTEPPVTEPPVTEPPVTEPPVTEPPVTEPPVTEPEPPSNPCLNMTLSELPRGEYYYSEDIVPLTREQQDIALNIAAEYDLPVELLYAIMRVETHFTPDLISQSNDYGIMQINSCNHDMMRKHLGVDNFLDYEQNVRCGAYMLHLCTKYSETLPQLLMCYNSGVNGARKKWEQGITFDYYCERITTELQELLDIRNADRS